MTFFQIFYFYNFLDIYKLLVTKFVPILRITGEELKVPILRTRTQPVRYDTIILFIID